jgi:hypothetical protein
MTKSKLLAFCALILMTACDKANVESDPVEDPGEKFSGEVESGIAQNYDGDEGIENDPDVLYVEKFEGDRDDVAARYTDVANREGMSLDMDVPAGSKAGSTSLRLTSVGSKNQGGHLFRDFTPGFDSAIYLRYYVKYPQTSKGYIHHEGIWFGGYDPVLSYPYPRAGSCDIDGRISIAFEPNGNDNYFDVYLYWPGMRSYDEGLHCYGNVMTNPRKPTVEYDQWTCIEIMAKLNYPATDSDGELAVWKDGVKVGHWRKGFPNGKWIKDHWDEGPGDPPFEGFRWRKSNSLNINHLWIEFYDDTSPEGVNRHVNYDHLVIARKYIGPLKN